MLKSNGNSEIVRSIKIHILIINKIYKFKNK